MWTEPPVLAGCGYREPRNPIALDLDQSCPNCIHAPHANVCNGYRQPLCGHDTDVCGCTTVARS